MFRKSIRSAFIPFVLVNFVCIISCSKSPTDPQSTEDSFKNLSGKYYIRSASTSNPAYPLDDGSFSTNIYADYYKDECYLDDLRMFRADSVMIYDNGATKCYSYEPQTAEGKWKLLENGTKLVLQPLPTNSDTVKILINDGETLKYENLQTKDGVIYTWIETWVKKK